MDRCMLRVAGAMDLCHSLEKTNIGVAYIGPTTNEQVYSEATQPSTVNVKNTVIERANEII